MTGCEVNGREDIDINAWNEIGPSDVLQSIYNGKEIKSFWSNLFQPQSLNPLIQQTFIRLIGNSGTIQHSDYYYFKKDTEIFNNKDGINAQKASQKYILQDTPIKNLSMSSLFHQAENATAQSMALSLLGAVENMCHSMSYMHLCLLFQMV